jgi:VanZ family protein
VVKINKKLLFIILISIAWIIVIFTLSNMPSEVSNSKSQGTINTVIEKTLEMTNDSGITDKHPTKEKINKVVAFLNKPLRKCMHASVYFILSILLYNLFCLYKISNWKRCILSVACSFLYACTDEFHQLFVDGRTGQFTDVLIDTLGAVLGVIVVNLILYFISKIKNKKKIECNDE